VTATQELVLHTADGCILEAEFRAAVPGDGRPVAIVLCHPHPLYGGTMRSIVVSALFDAMPERGCACLRFNFRGVERSTGEHSGGRDEPLDVLAAVDEILVLVPGATVVVAGWSFGGDMALSVTDPRLAGWVAIAPPLRFRGGGFGEVAHDTRPKHLVLAQHDEVRSPDEVAREVASWTNTTVDVVAGASHFFVGRTDRVVDATARFVATL
jgi:alpha/beta superfamily hydrolase